MADETQDDLHLIADVLPVFIARVDREQRYRFNNRAYEKFFGLKPQELYGKTIREVLGEDSYRQVQPHLEAAFAGEGQVFENFIRDHNGNDHVLQVQYIPRLNAKRKVDEVIVLVSDVTDQRRAQEEIRRLNQELEQRVQRRTAQLESANRELEAFCYSVSHDLRAPLRAVRGFTEVLLEQYAERLDPKGQDFLRRVREASSQMDTLVEDLLRLSRVSRGEIQNQEVNLSAIAEDILTHLSRSEPRHVEIVVASELRARGDERLVRVVLDNLLRNAWKFTGKRQQARIEFGQTPEGTFFVRDNGVGFDMAYAERLFGVFQRLHSVTDFPGSGVGLAIAQRVINRHGGRIWAEAVLNDGATFYFTLPGGGDS